MAIEQAQPKHLHAGSWRIAAERLRLAAAVVTFQPGLRWRASWYYDARSGGLALFAERGLTPNREFTANEDVREVVPALLKLEVRPDGRTYHLRPLPGQDLSHFTRAEAPLRVRWKATAVKASMSPHRRGVVLLDVEVGQTLEQVVRYGART